jgi:hypothetical protein
VAERAPTERERAVLELLLSGDFPGAAELRAQLPGVRVVRAWSAGSASADLRVTGPAAPAAGVPSPLPVGALVRDDAGEPVGELLVWLDGGRLAGLEYAWFTDDPPTELPDPANVELS